MRICWLHVVGRERGENTEALAMQQEGETTTVLVCLLNRTREVTFCTDRKRGNDREALVQAIHNTFADIEGLTPSSQLAFTLLLTLIINPKPHPHLVGIYFAPG